MLFMDFLKICEFSGNSLQMISVRTKDIAIVNFKPSLEITFQLLDHIFKLFLGFLCPRFGLNRRIHNIVNYIFTASP